MHAVLAVYAPQTSPHEHLSSLQQQVAFMRQACLLLWLVGCAATAPVASSAGARSAPAMEPCEGARPPSTPHVRARLQAPQRAGGRGCGHLRVCVRGVLAGVAAAAAAAAAAPAAAAAAAVAAAAAATAAAAGAAAAGAAAAAAATVHRAAVLRRPRQCLRCPAASHRSRRAFGAVIGTAGHATLGYIGVAERASWSVRAMAHARPRVAGMHGMQGMHGNNPRIA